ncbi:hypothetical protein [Saccharothrix obliqua]|uniref:hypothetical protein n=1 Tax=Saccharothrix obliqua TaxID=2861747 RepID=UPI001C5D9306|nr:hypothetical protein [Saccharothrix obliqua]MBW4719656.1 hypothetical protein [Saccharothrix obliqua]
MTELDERLVVEPQWNREEFADVVRQLAEEAAPRLFALVEEYGDRAEARVAGYGMAFPDRADVNSVEGDFPLRSQNPESARQVFEVSSRSRGVRVHVVWLNDSARGPR